MSGEYWPIKFKVKIFSLVQLKLEVLDHLTFIVKISLVRSPCILLAYFEMIYSKMDSQDESTKHYQCHHKALKKKGWAHGFA